MGTINIKTKCYLPAGFFIGFLLIGAGVNAQEIKDDTLYFRANSTVDIQFPSTVDSFSTIPIYTGYNLKKEKNTISIQAKSSNTAQAVLAIAEGGREHRFVLRSGNNNLGEKTIYDYSTMDKLNDHTWDLKLLKNKNSLPVAKDNLPKTKNDLKYDSLIAVADKALNDKLLEIALQNYSAALSLKQTEYYPNAQIKYIREEMAYLQKQKVQQSILQKDPIEENYQKLITIADNAVKEKRYKEAKQAYKSALIIHPKNTYALQRLKIAENQLKLETSVKDSTTFLPPTEELRNILNSKFTWQKNPIPYSDQELKKMYTKINFNKAPEGQQYNTNSVLSRDHSRILNELIMTYPKIAFSSTDQDIHLINTDITFYDSLVYVKLILQNDSKNDFLTGPMLLTWQRPNNAAIKLYPIYLYPEKFPIVQPGKQMVIIYVCKPYVVSNADYLKFEMTDRLDKVHLQIKIPGSGWNNSDYNKYFIKTVDYREERLMNEPQ